MLPAYKPTFAKVANIAKQFFGRQEEPCHLTINDLGGKP
jgi:hypothetical protein